MKLWINSRKPLSTFGLLVGSDYEHVLLVYCSVTLLSVCNKMSEYETHLETVCIIHPWHARRWLPFKYTLRRSEATTLYPNVGYLIYTTFLAPESFYFSRIWSQSNWWGNSWSSREKFWGESDDFQGLNKHVQPHCHTRRSTESSQIWF